MTEIKRLTSTVPAEMAGMRLDRVLATMFAEYSRARLQQWIRDGQVLIDQKAPRIRDKVHGGELVEIEATIEEETGWEAESIPLDILYEDRALLVINKPAGLVVHPAVGNRQGTMLNALLHHAPELAMVPRAGIVHRLDKDTSGILVVARTIEAQKQLVDQLQARAFVREYDAIVQGTMTAGGTVDAPIGRHPVQRTRRAVSGRGKEAITHYRIAERFRFHTHLSVQLETGRTHQIRVHMAHIKHPIIGDPVYGGRLRIPQGGTPALIAQLRQFKRQALHARRLGLQHPESGEALQWEVAMPDDMQQLIAALRDDLKHHNGE